MRARLIGRAQGRAEPSVSWARLPSVMNASRKACCCCSANGSRVGWRMAPVWIPPVTVKLEASAARPSVRFEKRGDRRQALEGGHVGHALRVGPGDAHHQGEKARSRIPSLFMAPLLRARLSRLCRAILLRHQEASVHAPAGTGSRGREEAGASDLAAPGRTSRTRGSVRRHRVMRRPRFLPISRSSPISADDEGESKLKVEPSCRFSEQHLIEHLTALDLSAPRALWRRLARSRPPHAWQTPL